MIVTPFSCLFVLVQLAEILVKAFPNPEDVRVSLRDKYNSLHQRFRHCVVKGTMHDTDGSTEWTTKTLINWLINGKPSVFMIRPRQ